METYQTNIIKVLDTLINDNESETIFQAGYIFRESIDDKNAKTTFGFNEINGYKLTTKEYVPTMYGGFFGSINPTSDVFDEKGTIQISFTPYVTNSDKEFVLGTTNSEIETFIRNVSGYSTTVTIDEETFYIAFSSTPLIQDGGSFVLNGRDVVSLSTTINYRISNSPLGNKNTYKIRRLGETEFKKIVRVGTTSGQGSTLDPYQNVTKREANSDKGSTAFQITLSFYNTDNCLSEDIANRLIPYIISTDESGVETITENLVLTQVYELEMNVNDTRGFRQVIIESENYNDGIGTPIILDVTFRQASDVIISKENDRLGL